ncbi:MAG TPA: TolC family protein, partial [Nitrospiria bacterium]
PPPGAADFEALAKQTPAYRLPEAQARSAEADVTAARSGFFPEIQATGTVSRGGEDFPPERDQWTAGLLLTLPLFSGGRDYYGLQGARSGYRRAQESLLSAGEQAVLDLERSHADFQDSIERVNVRQDFLSAGEVRAQIARGLYTSGLLSFENWDPIENDLIAARKEMLAGLRDRMNAEAAWERAQGRGAVP